MSSDDDRSSDEDVTFGSVIRKARIDCGLTQEELGHRISQHGYRLTPSAKTIGRWERGSRPVPQLAIAHLEAVLGVKYP